jgi:hypothetical protein
MENGRIRLSEKSAPVTLKAPERRVLRVGNLSENGAFVVHPTVKMVTFHAG